jgi:hypothetical protein
VFCSGLPEVIQLNPDKPECNGPFLIYRVPNFDGAKDGTEFKGFYIILRIDKEFLEIDDTTNWFSANITVAKHVTFQVNVTVAIANWEGISRKASARDNRKGLK